MQLAVSVLAVLLFLSGAAAVPAADKRVNFTGHWTLNAQKSDFGIFFAPKAATVKISHKGTELKITDVETNEQGETNRSESTYVIDGKESTLTLIVMPFPVTGVMKWKEGSLAFDGKGSTSGIDFQVQETWLASSDGKSITIERHFLSARGNTNEKIILEK